MTLSRIGVIIGLDEIFAKGKVKVMGNIVFYDIKKEPFRIYGLYEPRLEGAYRRIPTEVARATSKAVEGLNTNTAGGRIRFKTDSDVIAVRAKGNMGPDFIQTPLNKHGFDVYLDRPNGSVYMGCPKPEISLAPDYEFEINVGGGEKEITVDMPLYGNVFEVLIGLREGASLERHSPYKHERPVVYYGSSITQGACASRPGRCYEAIISRRYDLNYINLGFSGSARAEDAIVEYMAGLDMAAFVSDYDHNAPTVEYLKNTHFGMYEKIREKNHDIPYFMITKPDFRFEKDFEDRRATVMESYVKARASGDTNVYFIDGSAFFNGTPVSELTVDRCHPNDEGFGRMATYIGDIIAKVMDL